MEMRAWLANQIVLMYLSKMKMLEVYLARDLKMRDQCIVFRPSTHSFKTDITIRAKAATHTRNLDDDELDSGDDEGRRDRVEDGADGDASGDGLYERRENILKASIGRNAGPRPSDGEVRVARDYVGTITKNCDSYTFFSFPTPLVSTPKPSH